MRCAGIGETSIGGGLGVGYGFSNLSKSRLGIGACSSISSRFLRARPPMHGKETTHNVRLSPVRLRKRIGHHLVGVEEINPGPAVKLIRHAEGME